jgi:hypothetical protein
MLEQMANKRAPKGYVTGVGENLKPNQYIKKEDAVKINNIWYKKGSAAVQIGESWVVRILGQVEMDARTNKWNFVNSMIHGIIGIDPESRIFKSGHWSIAPEDGSLESGITRLVRVVINDGQTSYAENPEKALAMGLEEHIPTGIFFDPKSRDLTAINEVLANQARHTSFNQFNGLRKRVVPLTKVSDELKVRINSYNYKFGVDSSTNLITESKPYTFGVELETSSGTVPAHAWLNRLNIKCVRDGSIPAGEYVTGVLKGDQGFNHLKTICNELAVRCKTNQQCGVHVHIGNIAFTKEFNVLVYVLGQMLQDELFSMLPASRKGNTYCTPLNSTKWLNSSKLRTLLLPSLSSTEYKLALHDVYNDLFSHLSLGAKLSKGLSRVKPHPGGHYAGGHSSPRYNWLNLIVGNFAQRGTSSSTIAQIPTHFDENGERPPSTRPRGYSFQTGEFLGGFDPYREAVRSLTNRRVPSMSSSNAREIKKNIVENFTIEFRCHSATLNYVKVKNWILICMGIVSFVENRSARILDALRTGKYLTLAEVISATYSKKKTEILLKYIQERKSIFNNQSGNEETALTIKVPNCGNVTVLNTVKETEACV